MSRSLLTVNGLRISFRRDGEWNEVVHGINFEVEQGTTLGIVGESGSGKSVTSLSIMRLLDERLCRITAESISLDGVEISSMSEEQMRAVRGSGIAMIFQEPMTSLNPVYRCGFQVVEAIQAHEDISQEDAKERVLTLFRQVKLPRPEHIFDSYPHELSGGQKQRVMIAMAIACKPKVLIADEPTTALDVTVQQEIIKLLKQLQEETGMAIIFITHDLGVVSEIADNIIVMHSGVIVESGPMQQVLSQPRDPYTQGLLACRPPLDTRLVRLPVVKEFIEGRWQGGQQQVIQELGISDEERQRRLDKLYSQEPLLQVEGIKTWYPLRRGVFSRIYDYVKAVDEVNFEVFPGETLGLVGESGCGKTTLGRSILRLIEPTEGKIIFQGLDIMKLKNRELRHFRKKAQIIFQDPYSSLNPRMTIGEAIAEPMLVHKIQPDSTKRRHAVCELLEQVGLQASHYQRYPHEFSGGQRQRICIARALAVNPELVICDESVSALDVSVQAQVLNLLNRLKQERNLTYIFISHDLGVVRYMSDRILVMQNGKPMELDDADTLFQQPQNPYTQKLLQALPGRKLHSRY